ncbi:MAG TPA: hypothetical protein VF006_27655 [Longimicrobium sp.]
MGNPRLRAAALSVTGLRCSYEAEFEESCVFLMTETVADTPPVRSRCRAVLTIAGTSHSLAQWELQRTDEGRRITCSRVR